MEFLRQRLQRIPRLHCVFSVGYLHRYRLPIRNRARGRWMVIRWEYMRGTSSKIIILRYGIVYCHIRCRWRGYVFISLVNELWYQASVYSPWCITCCLLGSSSAITSSPLSFTVVGVEQG